MKKVLFFLFSLTLTPLLFSQGLDPVVAKVTYTKTDIITHSDLMNKVAIVERLSHQSLNQEQKKQLLDSMVKEVVVLQAAEKNGMRVTEAEVIQYTKNMFRFQGSDEELKKAVGEQLKMTWPQYLEAQKKTLILQKYIQTNPKLGDLQKVGVSDSEIQQYYNANKTQFVEPDMVRISHIFFDTKKNPKGTLEEIRKRAEEVQRQISSGQVTFEEMVRKNSEDDGSKNNNGDIGFLPRSANTPQGKQIMDLFGENFVSSVFNLKKGEVSKVINSGLGLHIVKVTDRLEQRFLTLQDPIAPLQKTTVYDYIKAGLTQKLQQEGLNTLMEGMVEGLMKTAKVEIFEKNI